jgi:undecaprenyl diphosphate synthase
MDGNGRWAKEKGQHRAQGHEAGTKNIREVAQAFGEQGVEYLTLYAFSTENWDRPHKEITSLLSILGTAVDKQAKALHHDGVRLLHIGRLDRISRILRRKIENVIKLTQHNTGLTLVLAFDYGGRSEIIEAIRKILNDSHDPQTIDEKTFEAFLYTSQIPEPDLIIRTAGEMRLSNFLIWQSAYSEYYATKTLWPDFKTIEVEKALNAYRQRHRSFGRIDNGISDLLE